MSPVMLARDNEGGEWRSWQWEAGDHRQRGRAHRWDSPKAGAGLHQPKGHQREMDALGLRKRKFLLRISHMNASSCATHAPGTRQMQCGAKVESITSAKESLSALPGAWISFRGPGM